MGNNVKDINIKSHTYYFLVVLSIQKNLIQIILKQMKSHTNILLFTTLHM